MKQLGGTQDAYRPELTLAHYSFHLLDGRVIKNDEGCELPTLSAAREHGVKFVAKVLADAGEAIFADQDWRLEVADDKGLILFTLHVIACDAAAVSRPMQLNERV